MFFLSDVICTMDFHPVCLCFSPRYCMDDMLWMFIWHVFKLTSLFLFLLSWLNWPVRCWYNRYWRSECSQDNQAWHWEWSLCHQSSCLDFSFGLPVTLRWKVWFTSSMFCCRALSVYWYLTHFCLSVHSHLACVCQWLAFNVCAPTEFCNRVFLFFSLWNLAT